MQVARQRVRVQEQEQVQVQVQQRVVAPQKAETERRSLKKRPAPTIRCERSKDTKKLENIERIHCVDSVVKTDTL